jgi:hypothetical protein
VDATGSDHADEGGEHAPSYWILDVACFSVVATNVANALGDLYVEISSTLTGGVSPSLQTVVERRKSNVVIMLVLFPITGKDDGGVSGSNLHLGGAGGDDVGTTCISSYSFEMMTATLPLPFGI